MKLHKDGMQARLKPSTAPHFVRGHEMTVVTKNIFLRGQPNMKLRYRHLGPSLVEDLIAKHSLFFQTTVTRDISLTPNVSLQQFKTMLYILSSTCCPGDLSKRRRRGVRHLSHLLCVHQVVTWTTTQIFTLHDAIQWWRHSTRLAPIEQGTSYYGVSRFLGGASTARVCQYSRVHRLHARSSGAHSYLPITTSVKEPRPPRRLASRLASSICQEGEGMSVTSTYVTIHYLTLYIYSLLT
jgi:hypothetical protein